jgi:hypothetical protein
MQVQILLDGKIVSTHQVTPDLGSDDPTIEARRTALRDAIKDGKVSIGQVLRVTFRVDEQIDQPNS